MLGSIVTTEMKIKTPTGYHYMPINMAKMKKKIMLPHSFLLGLKSQNPGKLKAKPKQPTTLQNPSQTTALIQTGKWCL